MDQDLPLELTRRPRSRYLWTDAFAVQNLVALGQRDEALVLVAEVERTLGVPTGGLRIGKPLPERGPGEPFDERLEWERDGQYLHYLTRWMTALAAVGQREAARQLARQVIPRFITEGGRLVWKMSVDLTRPLVASSGQHDALDALVTCQALGELEPQCALLAPLVLPMVTSDPLGLGGLLLLGARSGQAAILQAADEGLERLLRVGALDDPPGERLAFRELGLVMGLDAAGKAPALARRLRDLWLGERDGPACRRHQGINDVMLATCLIGPRASLPAFP